jgi:hypothetical protein
VRRTEIVQCVGFAGPMADLPEQGQGRPKVVNGRCMADEAQCNIAEIVECPGLASHVANLPENVYSNVRSWPLAAAS